MKEKAQQQQTQEEQVANSSAVKLKMNLQPFSRDKKNWRALSKVHVAQTRSLGFTAAFDAPEKEDIKIGNVGFDSYPRKI